MDTETNERGKEDFENMTQEQKKAALGKMKQKIPFYSQAYRQEFAQPGSSTEQR